MRTVVLGWVVRCNSVVRPEIEWLLGSGNGKDALCFSKEDAQKMAHNFNCLEYLGVFASAEEHEFPA